MNMTNTIYLTGKVKVQPILKELENKVATHVQLSTGISNKEATLTLIAHGDIAKQLAQVKPNSIILANLSIEDKGYHDHATGKRGWKTQLTVNDFVVLMVEDNHVVNSQVDTEIEHKRQSAICNVIFHEFL